jgi:ubiquinone/menaquinone biosynthesis C-methylase UbiE
MTMGRLFAAGYDRALGKTEEAGLAGRRQQLLERATGATLEIGAGTGLNLAHYPAGVTELVLTEPDSHMAARLRRRVAAADRDARVVEAPAESLPFEDATYDTVVATLVLCTVPDPAGALAEAHRVLRPGGTLLFLEHVRSESPGLARWQDRLMRPWRFLAAGCHCNRDTLATVEASALDLDEAARHELPKVLPLVRPAATGVAHKPG